MIIMFDLATAAAVWWWLARPAQYIGNRDISNQINDIKQVHLHNLYMRNILSIGPYLVRSMTKSRSTYITFL